MDHSNKKRNEEQIKLPKQLIELLEIFMVNFYEPKTGAIVNMIARRPGIGEEDIAKLMYDTVGEVGVALQQVMKEGIVKRGARISTTKMQRIEKPQNGDVDDGDDADDNYGGTKTKNRGRSATTAKNVYFYEINFDHFLVIVKYKLCMMRNRLWKEAQDLSQLPLVACELCKIEITGENIIRTFNKDVDDFICPSCKGVLKNRDYSDILQAKKDSMIYFNISFGPVYDLLKELDDMPVDTFNVELTNPDGVSIPEPIKVVFGGGTKQKESGMWMEKEQVAGKSTQTVDDSDANNITKKDQIMQMLLMHEKNAVGKKGEGDEKDDVGEMDEMDEMDDVGEMDEMDDVGEMDEMDDVGEMDEMDDQDD